MLQESMYVTKVYEDCDNVRGTDVDLPVNEPVYTDDEGVSTILLPATTHHHTQHPPMVSEDGDQVRPNVVCTYM